MVVVRVTLSCDYDNATQQKKMLLTGELIGYDTLTQWLSSVYSTIIHGGTLPDAVVILRDQAEGYCCAG